MRQRIALLALMAASLAQLAPARAKVAGRTLDEVARETAVIAVVKVDAVTTVEGLRVARATVVRPLKGAVAGARVAFVAAPIWPCDVSAAVPGEQALVLLAPLPERPRMRLARPAALAAAARRAFGDLAGVYLVAHSGRGRLTTVEHGGVAFVQARVPDLALPAGLATVAPPKERARQGALVRLGDLEAHLAAVIAAALPVEVVLVRASASRTPHDLLVRVTATLRNRSGAPLTVRTNFGGVFDGLTLVAAAADGRELARQAYIHHQSPYAENTPYVLPPGDTTRELAFPLAGLKDPPRVVRLRLIGGLPGTPITAGLQSQVVTARVAP